ncbi:hypothetical protein AQUCO_04000122v1 [Aquilegia coerulea]|uniref:OTU domain-containing protein n=1 Tax=Aquilegia coerulea TaxID=218851 RepID=A0A2G5CR93_AQUCA|nr:hypothetical protein AQUCO_04000122v1 [Aquilegia coerulea]
MGKLVCDSSTTIQASPPALPWRETIPTSIEPADVEVKTTWETVSGLEDQQKRYLQKLYTKGVLWKNPIVQQDSSIRSTIFRLSHGGDVEADGNCLFTASQKAMNLIDIDARELRRRTVKRFLEDLGKSVTDAGLDKESIDSAIKHLYSPDLKTGWGVHVVQELKLLAKKTDRISLDLAIKELVDFGLQREIAAETIYKERCIMVNDGLSWGKYMSISGSPLDEFDIITLQYTEEGLLSVDENRGGHAAAFGDDIAIESLATEFKREIYVVQAHGSDAMVEEENCVFFLPHRPRSQICGPPFFLFMKGTGWCCAGADHYEPLISYPAPLFTQEKAAVVL